MWRSSQQILQEERCLTYFDIHDTDGIYFAKNSEIPNNKSSLDVPNQIPKRSFFYFFPFFIPSKVLNLGTMNDVMHFRISDETFVTYEP